MLKHFKPQKIKSIKLLIVTISILLAGCKNLPVDVYDKEVCGDLGSDGARCNHTLVENTRNLSKDEWDKLRSDEGWMCMSANSFIETEATLEQLCDKNGCDYKTMQLIKQFKTQIKEIIHFMKSRE